MKFANIVVKNSKFPNAGYSFFFFAVAAIFIPARNQTIT